MEQEYVQIIKGLRFENDEFNSIYITSEDGKLVDIIDVEFTYNEDVFKNLCNEWIEENK